MYRRRKEFFATPGPALEKVNMYAEVFWMTESGTFLLLINIILLQNKKPQLFIRKLEKITR